MKRWATGFHYSVAHFLDYSRTAITHYRTMTHISGKLVRLFGLQFNENVREIAIYRTGDHVASGQSDYSVSREV